MTSNPSERELRIIGLLLAILLIAMAVIAVASWGLASLGLSVESLLSDEGLRWLFSQSAETALAPFCQWLLLLAIVVGAAAHSGLLARGPRDGLARRSALVVWLLCVSVLALLFLAPWSPLRSATGRLFPTPFLLGFLRALAVSVVIAAAVHAGVSGRLRTWPQYVTLIFIGIQRFAPWLVIVLMAVMLIHIINYAF